MASIFNRINIKKIDKGFNNKFYHLSSATVGIPNVYIINFIIPRLQQWEFLMYILYKENCQAGMQLKYYITITNTTTQEIKHKYYNICTTKVLQNKYNTSKQRKY